MRSGHPITAVAVAALVCATASFAHSDEIADAKRAFISGMKHFDLGEYRQALDDFKNGYRAKEDPVFLYNIAQCYRLLDERQDAIRYYRLYLSRAPAAPNRAEIEQRIQSLQTAGEDRPAVAAPAQPQPPSQSAATPGDVAPSPDATSLAGSAPPHSERTPVYKKWWLWTIVGVAAVGVGVGLGIGLTRVSPNTGTTFPTASF
jgi:tetratricopeptide (TPR) repeat protein